MGSQHAKVQRETMGRLPSGVALPEGQRAGDAQTEGPWRMELFLPLRGPGMGPRIVYLVESFLLGPLFGVW